MTPLLENLKTLSYSHYFCLRLLKRHEREHLTQLWHDTASIRCIPLTVHQPLAGFIRLTWWRDNSHRNNQQLNSDFHAFLNAFEFWFEDQDFEKLLHFTTHSERYFFSLSLQAMDLAADAAYAAAMGQCFGIKFALQAADHLRFDLTPEHIACLLQEFDSAYQKVNAIEPKQRPPFHCLKGALKLWRKAYQGQPLAFSVSAIQWSLFKTKLLG